MLSKATLIGNENRSWLNSATTNFLRMQARQRVVLVVVTLCVVSVVMCAALTTYAQRQQILLVSNTTAVQPSAVVTGPMVPVTTSSMIDAAKMLVRIDQSSLAQYASQAEHDTWWQSTCSAASMTEVINAYGHHYRITDILKVEAGIGAISPTQGLLTPTGIDQTAQHFGFQTQTLNNPTLNQILSIANGGKPVIVNFPPSTWPGGHFLVVLGSSTLQGTTYVHLADSSVLDMQYMTQDRFSSYWRGLAKVLTPQVATPTVHTTTAANTSSGQYNVVGKPTITASFINRVLAAYNSPAVGKGQALYDLGVKYGIDPAFALAFFMHESAFGTAGEAQTTKSLGNLRCYPGVTCVDQDRGGYASYPTWEAGFEAWYQLIRNYYVAQLGKTTIDQIIPVYAPPGDNNDSAYIYSLKQAISAWRIGQIKP
jgi:hypothetical protein